MLVIWNWLDNPSSIVVAKFLVSLWSTIYDLWSLFKSFVFFPVSCMLPIKTSLTNISLWTSRLHSSEIFFKFYIELLNWFTISFFWWNGNITIECDFARLNRSLRYETPKFGYQNILHKMRLRISDNTTFIGPLNSSFWRTFCRLAGLYCLSTHILQTFNCIWHLFWKMTFSWFFLAILSLLKCAEAATVVALYIGWRGNYK